jgi:hypothetical protein
MQFPVSLVVGMFVTPRVQGVQEIQHGVTALMNATVLAANVDTQVAGIPIGHLVAKAVASAMNVDIC